MDYRDHLTQIFRAGLRRVDPAQMMQETVRLEGDALLVRTAEQELSIDLSRFDRVVVLGAGKATATMARGLEAVLGDRIADGAISVKYGHTDELSRIRTIEAGHPVPDQNSVKGADEVLALAKAADERTLCINLVSGGGSALLCKPGDFPEAGLSIGLDQKQKTTKELLASGAPIQEINTFRKHLSGIKGGRLAAAMYPATSLNLILSDVIGDRLDSIASGLTAPDTTTYSDVADLIERYDLGAKLDPGVKAIVEAGVAGEIPETPKRGDPIFDRVHNVLLGTNYLAILAAAARARELGYEPVVITSRLVGEAREAAKFILSIAEDQAARELLAKGPTCLLFGGETTVTIRGEGKGGRNQEMALSALRMMADDPVGAAGIHFLAASTDGNDGPTDAAGAFADADLVRVALAAAGNGLSMDDSLKRNDSYRFFEALGGLLKTGATNTNVCDLQIVLVP